MAVPYAKPLDTGAAKAFYHRGTAFRHGRRSTQAEKAIGRRLRPSATASLKTEIAAAGPFYFAEDQKQQYLVNNPMGYCQLGDTGITCPVGLTSA